MEINLDLSRLQVPELIVMAIAGVLLLLLGYRIKKTAFFILWFLIGFNLMRILLPQIEGFTPIIKDSQFWQTLLPIAGGLLLAMLGFTIEKLCVGGIVFGLTLMITSELFGTEVQTLVIGAIVGVVLAGFSVMLMKPTIIIASSIMGGYVLTLTILTLMNGINPDTYYIPLLIGISAVGVVTQFATTRHIN